MDGLARIPSFCCSLTTPSGYGTIDWKVVAVGDLDAEAAKA